MRRGKFISLEGGEGAGKSTQAKRLEVYLQKHGVDVVLTREVGGNPSAEAIRELWLGKPEGFWTPLTELLLVSAARREHVVRTIAPALERGAWVISDRFADSTRAYQGLGLGIGLSLVDRVQDFITPGFEPDLTLLLDLPVDIGLARMSARNGPDDRYQQKDPGFHQTLRDAYLHLAKIHAGRFVIIDASKDASAVTTAIEEALREKKFVTNSKVFQ